MGRGGGQLKTNKLGLRSGRVGVLMEVCMVGRDGREFDERGFEYLDV